MFEQIAFQKPEEYFLGLSRRREKNVFFYRLNGYSESVKAFLEKYYESARKNGVVIEGRIPNPDEKNLAYYEEMMGMEFRMDPGFISSALKKWLPRMNEYQRKNVASSIYDTLDAMRKEGKNENMLRNAYIKFMCWLYYKFERIVNRLGEEEVPKILYEGTIGGYELKLVMILSKSGCDVLLLQYDKDAGYRKLDPESKLSRVFAGDVLEEFPEGFCLRSLREEAENRQRIERLYGTPPSLASCTNAWLTGKWEEDILTPPRMRVREEAFFYNAFIRVTGVEDKVIYANQLLQLCLKLKSEKRKVVVINKQTPPPATDEIAEIKHQGYQNIEQLALDLSVNIRYTANIELQRLMIKAFLDVVLEEYEKEKNMNRLTNKAVSLLCWLRRYQGKLFGNWSSPDTGVFIHFGGCRTENEVLFLKLLSKLPVDVLILIPNQNETCRMQDKMLYEIRYADTLAIERFPEEETEFRAGTAAYHAERELDTLMYQDSGIYRNMQYKKALSVSLQTMYEEIEILWDQELKFRPNFQADETAVQLPVIFAKVSGVKDGNVSRYWSDIKKLMTPDAFVVKNVPLAAASDANPIKPFAVEFYKNGRLLREKIKSHKAYQYTVLRDEMQDYILDKLQLLIEQRAIKGTFENGTEYTVISTVLNLGRDIMRMLQKFDFTKKNPKIIYINTTERIMNLEESIIMAFLNLVGFDIVFFIPTGYQNVEKYFTKTVMEEHRIGEYMYDLPLPDFERLPSGTRQSWREKIFKRGN